MLINVTQLYLRRSRLGIRTKSQGICLFVVNRGGRLGKMNLRDKSSYAGFLWIHSRSEVQGWPLPLWNTGWLVWCLSFKDCLYNYYL
jgi:hypothetical protein